MNIKIELEEILQYLDDGLLYEAFMEYAGRASEEDIIEMEKHLMACRAFKPTPVNKK